MNDLATVELGRRATLLRLRGEPVPERCVFLCLVRDALDRMVDSHRNGGYDRVWVREKPHLSVSIDAEQWLVGNDAGRNTVEAALRLASVRDAGARLALLSTIEAATLPNSLPLELERRLTCYRLQGERFMGTGRRAVLKVVLDRLTVAALAYRAHAPLTLYGRACNPHALSLEWNGSWTNFVVDGSTRLYSVDAALERLLKLRHALPGLPATDEALIELVQTCERFTAELQAP